MCVGALILAACGQDGPRVDEPHDEEQAFCVGGRIPGIEGLTPTAIETRSGQIESREECESMFNLLAGPAAETPPLPEGLAPVSEHLEFTAREDAEVTIQLPLDEPVASTSEVGFYSYIEDEWRRIADVVLLENGTLAEGTFESPPPNLIVLKKK